MATKRLKAWFFAITSELRADGTIGGVRLRKTDKPTRSTMQDLLESTAFTTESADRAKVSTGATLASEQGLSVLASDVQAKANAAQLTDRSLVTQPHQLPTLEVITNSATEDMPTTGLFTQTGAATTRNQYQIRFAGSWITWLISRIFKSGGIEGDVPIKTNGTDYNWSWANIGNNTTTVNAIANNTNFVNTLLANSTFITNITNTIITNNPAAITEALEVGFMRVHPITAMPSAKWLRCDGSALNAVVTPGYQDLYDLIGNTYGGADNTNFQLPDLRDKQITGYSGTKAIGSTFGTETHTLIGDNLPPHNHSLGGATGTTTGTTDAPNDVSHTHSTALTQISGVGGNVAIVTNNVTDGIAVPYVSSAPSGNLSSHTHTFTGSTVLATGNTGNGAGTSTAINHLDPYLATNIIIKVLP